mgnify:CR=1 FL=1
MFVNLRFLCIKILVLNFDYQGTYWLKSVTQYPNGDFDRKICEYVTNRADIKTKKAQLLTLIL